MSNDLNAVSVVGRLTRDAELKYTQSGSPVVNAYIASNYRSKSGDTWTDAVNFFDVTFFGKAAEAVHKYLTKGKQIAIAGELRQERWDQDGQARSKVKIIAHSIQLLGDGNRQGQGNGSVATAPSTSADDGDDVPF